MKLLVSLEIVVVLELFLKYFRAGDALHQEMEKYEAWLGEPYIAYSTKGQRESTQNKGNGWTGYW